MLACQEVIYQLFSLVFYAAQRVLLVVSQRPAAWNVLQANSMIPHQMAVYLAEETA